MKKILVSFSGGFDSTFLVYDNLKKGHEVTGVYTTIENNIEKVKVEKNQIKKLENLFKEEFPNKFNLEIGMSINAQSGNDIMFKQILIWLISLLYNRSSHYDEVQIGAVMNDDMISFIDDIKKTWNSFKFLNPKHPILTFPLIKKSKYDISISLPKKYKDLVVYCESPIIQNEDTINFQFKNCELCHSCKRYKYDVDLWGIDDGYGQIQNHKDDSPSSNTIWIKDMLDNLVKSEDDVKII